MTMRRSFFGWIIVFLMLLLCACGSKTTTIEEEKEDKKPSTAVEQVEDASDEEDSQLKEEDEKAVTDEKDNPIKDILDKLDKEDEDESPFHEKTEANSKIIRVMAFTDEVPRIIQKYLDMHPEIDYTLDTTIVSTVYNEYQPALDEMLKYGNAPDIYALETAFVLKYTQGDASSFAATYDELGIDTVRMLKESQTATYASEIGTRPGDDKVVALPYQGTGGCFIYRRSVAKDTWGTDDPAYVQQKIGGGSYSWNQFWVAAEELKAKGYGIISGADDIWRAIENSADQSWIVDGKLYIDPKRESLLEVSKMMWDLDYNNKTQEWQDIWFADMKGEGQKEVLGFFGPAWLINYTMKDNCGGRQVGEGTYGDWAVCNSPVGFSWGGTYVASGKSAVDKMSDEKKAVVADIIQWITLDYDENSLQYMWANGTFESQMGIKDAVVSGTVMKKADGRLDFLGGQNMFDYYVAANDLASGRNLTPYDELINTYWKSAVRDYVTGNVDRDGAIAQFKSNIKSRIDIVVD